MMESAAGVMSRSRGRKPSERAGACAGLGCLAPVPTTICNFATPDGMIAIAGLRGRVSYGAAPGFPAILAAIAEFAMADSGAAVGGVDLPMWICVPEQQGGNARAADVLVNGGCG